MSVLPISRVELFMSQHGSEETIPRRMTCQLSSLGSMVMVNTANTIGMEQRINKTILFNLVSLILKNCPQETKRIIRLKKVIPGTKNRLYLFSSGIISLTWSDISERSWKLLLTRKESRKKKQNAIIPIDTSSPIKRILGLGTDLLRPRNNITMRKVRASDINAKL
jgi:hypothetical protein